MFGLKLIDNARRDLHRFWTVRLAIAHATFVGIAAVIGAFIDVFNPWFLVVVSVFVSIAIVLLRGVQQAPPPKPEVAA